MIGIDDIAISFVVSYVAGNIPTLKDYFTRNKDLKTRMNDCYNRAVEKWTKSVELQDSMRDTSYRHMDNLCAYIQKNPEGKHPRHNELMKLWADELRNDQLCYSFILEKKEDLALQKLDKQEEHLDSQDRLLKDMNEKLTSMLAGKDNNEIKKLIESLLKKNIADLIEHLRYDEANKIVRVIENSHISVIKDDIPLYSEFEYRKGQILEYTDKKESAACLHHAYEMCPSDLRYLRSEALHLLSLKKIDDVKRVIEFIGENDILKQSILVALNDNPREAYAAISDELKNNYALRQFVLLGLLYMGKMDDIDFLFPNEAPVMPEDLKQSNLNEWTYILNYYRIKIKETIIFTRQAPIISDFRVAYDVYDRFFSLLEKTDASMYYKELRALYCYWGFFAKEDDSLLAEYQNIDGLKQSDHKYLFILMESAMLLVAGREQEAFATIISIKNDTVNDKTLMSTYTNCLAFMSLHTNSLVYLNWMCDICKESDFKIETEISKVIAMTIHGKNAAEIKNSLQKVEFNNNDDKKLIVQLCNYMMNIDVDVESVKSCIKNLDDTLTAFAAMILSAKGEEEYAYDILNPKVDKDKVDFKQRIFLDVLTRSKAHRPELYRLLQKNRKNGYDKENVLLDNEFNLAMLLADMNNALEIITILYERNPEHEFEFVNMLIVLGQVHPEKLKDYKKKALSFEYSSVAPLMNVYQAFASNNYLDTAAELLYKNFSLDEEIVKTEFYRQSTMGPIHDIVNKKFDVAEEGRYVFIEHDNMERNAYKITSTSPLGVAVMGKKAGDEVNVDIDYSGKKRKVKIIGVFNKYFKAKVDFMHEMRDTGGNAIFRPMVLDMEHPLQSLEEAINKMDPQHKERVQRQSEALKNYAEGSLGMVNLVDANDIVVSYYKMLFSQFKVYVLPVGATEQLFPVLRHNDIKFVLDLPGLIILFEFAHKYNVSYNTKFILPKYTYEYLKRYQKTVKYNIKSDYYEACKSGNIELYSKSYDTDMEQRIQALIEWVDANCSLIVDETALAVTDGDKDDHQLLFSNTMTQIMKPNNFLLSDDCNVRNYVNGIPLLSTETYMYLKEPQDVAKKFTEYLLDCNFMGLKIDRYFIFNEYMNMEHGKENKWLSITMNAEINPAIFCETMSAGLMMVKSSLNYGLMTMSLTNLLVMSLTRMSQDMVNTLWQQTMLYLRMPSPNLQILKDCFRDAREIAGK